MPEIAEVRTVARTLNNSIVGKKIMDIDVIYPKIIKSDISEFIDGVKNKTITSVDNYGKWLFIVLGDKTIMSHLRMEGKYFVKNSDAELERHEHIIFHLNDNTDLRYHDTRKFGVMKLVNTCELYKEEEISKLGIEPDNKALTKEYIYNALKKNKKPIKSILLDQTIINGLGNIYADEVLFKSGINPCRLGSSITLKECEKIKNAAHDVIEAATLKKGTTIRSYTSSLGVYGTYQDELCVHTRSGTPCPNCSSIIVKTKVNGRGTYYCPKCQK